MADGNGPGRITLNGVVFGILILVLIVSSLWLFIAKPWWFPELASEHGGDIDRVFTAVLVVTGIAFVVVQGLLGFFVARYGAHGNERAAYWHDNPKAEAFLLIATAVILTVLVFMGQRVWAAIYFTDPPENALLVRVTGEQFQWNFHYAGADGVFGPRDVRFVSGTNSIGLDRDHPDAQDDIMTVGQMAVPSGRPVRVELRSNDVIHSFFLPYQRVKQDAVPGMAIEIWFTPTTPGFYEIACAELCGQAHYRMRAFLTVTETEEEFNNWLQERLAEQ